MVAVTSALIGGAIAAVGGPAAAATLGAAALGAGASVMAGNSQAKAIKNAGNVQQQSQNQALQFQRESRDQARDVLSKYAVEGNAARGRQRTFLGLNNPAGGGQYSGAMGSTQGRPDYAAYVRNSPDLAAEFSKPGVAQQFGGDPAAYGQWHAQTFADREVPNTGMGQPGQADPTATPAETQEQAWAAFEASPWGKIGTMEAQQARDNFITSAGAQGSALSGRTARGMAEVSEEAKLRNFGGYYGALGGVTERGYSADTGIASGGQMFADRAANITQQGGQNAANLAIAKGQNQGNTANDLASWIGWGMGKMPTGDMPSNGGTMYGGGSGSSSAARGGSGVFGGSRIR
jgi:hypothetical protein